MKENVNSFSKYSSFFKKKQKAILVSKAEHQSLMESRNLLQTVFDASTIAIAILEPLCSSGSKITDFKILQVNKILVDFYQREDMVGKNYTQVSNYDSETHILKDLIHAAEIGKKMEKEIFLKFEGKNRWFKILATPHNNLLVFSFEDITKQKLEAKSIKENINFKRQIAHTSPDIILILNTEKNFLRYCNRDLSEYFPDKSTAPKATDFYSVIHPLDKEKAIAFHRDIIQATDDEILLLEFRLKNKKQFQWFLARSKVFQRNKKGVVIEYMLLLQDVTEQKKTQSALINAEKLSIKGEVARTLAHEMRNPLASIRLATDVLKQKIVDQHTTQAENYLNIINRSAKMLNNLVTELLSSSNYSPVVLKEVNLCALLDETLEQATDRLYLNGVKIIKRYEDNCPILADEDKLKIALTNLIINANEAMRFNEGILEVSVARIKKEIVLKISDNGCGLERDQITRLFDAFYSSKPHGIGVGLSSVKNILEEHDAVIDVQSTPQMGTTFSIFFNTVH